MTFLDVHMAQRNLLLCQVHSDTSRKTRPWCAVDDSLQKASCHDLPLLFFRSCLFLSFLISAAHIHPIPYPQILILIVFAIAVELSELFNCAPCFVLFFNFFLLIPKRNNKWNLLLMHCALVPRMWVWAKRSHTQCLLDNNKLQLHVHSRIYTL